VPARHPRLRYSAVVITTLCLAAALLVPSPVHAQSAPPLDLTGQASGSRADASSGGSFPNPSQWLVDAVSGTLVRLGGTILAAAQHDVDWAMGQDGQGADFVSRTPPSISYQSPSVRELADRVRAAANVALAAIAMWAGYQVMAGSRTRGAASVQTAMEVLPRLALGALLANTSLSWGALAIDGANALGSLAGPVVLPGRDIARDLPMVLELVASGLVYWLVALLLVLQQLMRLALVDALLVLSPLALLLWTLPQTQAWGRLWNDLFLTAVFAQPVQMLVLKLGTLLLGELRGGGPLVSLFLAVGVGYLVLKLPGMLRGGLVRGGGGMGAGALAMVVAGRQLGRVAGIGR